MSMVDVFVSFDVDHDEELYEQLVEESTAMTSSFAVSGSSERLMNTDVSREAARCRIRDADQVIVICGEHTGVSTRMSTELRLAQEEQTPYLLLWGRRDVMCTKPMGAKSDEGMYSWTPQILQDQIATVHRKSLADAATEAARAARKARSNPSGASGS